MTKVTYGNSSQYAKTPQASWFLANLVFRAVPRDGTDALITLASKYANRPDRLSYDLYNTTNYMWTFQILNPDLIKDPIFDMVAGMQIYVATSDRLQSLLGV